MKVTIHLERLVLEGCGGAVHDVGPLQQVLAERLQMLLATATPDIGPAFVGESVRGADLVLPSRADARWLGEAIASRLHGAMVQAPSAGGWSPQTSNGGL